MFFFELKKDLIKTDQAAFFRQFLDHVNSTDLRPSEQLRIQHALDGCTADVEPTDQTVPCHRCGGGGGGGCRISGFLRKFWIFPKGSGKLTVRP